MRKSGSAASSPSGSSNAAARRGSVAAASGSSTISSCRVAVALGHRARELALVVALVGEADGERPHRLGRRLRHLRDDDRRVDARPRAARRAGRRRRAACARRRTRSRARARATPRRSPARRRSPAASSARSSPTSPSTTRSEPGSSRCTPRRPVRVPGTYCSARYASSAGEVGLARGSPGARGSAFSSDANAIVPSSSRVQTSGFLPSRSRASTSRRRGASQSAIANMPSSRSTKRGPSSS